MKKGIIILGLLIISFMLIGIGFVSASYSCSNDNDCKVHICSTVCVNDSFTTPEGVGCSYPPSKLPDYCKCENNTCKDYKAAGGPICGNGHCEGEGEKQNCPQDCNITLVGNDSDAHGCKGSAGYSWCEEKQKCLRIWEENCSDVSNNYPNCQKDDDCPICTCGVDQDCGACSHPKCVNNKCDYGNETLPGEGKVKILPETASLRARERLGELGFNVSLKEVGVPIKGDKPGPTKFIYEVSAVKEGKMFGLFKVKGKVSAEVDAETGDVLKVHKPWWGFMAGI